MPEIAGYVASVTIVNGGAAEEGASFFKFSPVCVIVATVLVDCRSKFDALVAYV
jgi:hypothetical protein